MAPEGEDEPGAAEKVKPLEAEDEHELDEEPDTGKDQDGKSEENLNSLARKLYRVHCPSRLIAPTIRPPPIFDTPLSFRLPPCSSHSHCSHVFISAGPSFVLGPQCLCSKPDHRGVRLVSMPKVRCRCVLWSLDNAMAMAIAPNPCHCITIVAGNRARALNSTHTPVVCQPALVTEHRRHPPTSAACASVDNDDTAVLEVRTTCHP